MNNKEWFERMWQLEDFLILGTETTGMGEHDAVVQIGIINKAGEVLFDSPIRPKVNIHPNVAAVHGIIADTRKDSPTVAGVFWELRSVIEGRGVLAYNAPFDRRLLKQSLRQAGRDDLTSLCRWYDVMKPYARLYGASSRWQNPAMACAQQGIGIVNAHSAVGDCQMTLALMRRLGEGSDEQ